MEVCTWMKKIVIKAHEIIFAPKRTSPLCHWIDKNLPAPARAIAVAVANKIAFRAIASRLF